MTFKKDKDTLNVYAMIAKRCYCTHNRFPRCSLIPLYSGVNFDFINILHLTFLYKNVLSSYSVLIALVNFIIILYEAFSMKVLFAAFLCLQFVFILFWQKERGKKAGCKMFVKLTTHRCQFHHHFT